MRNDSNKVKAEIDNRCTVGEGADADAVYTGTGGTCNCVKIDAPRRFELDLRRQSIAPTYRHFQGRRRHVVQQHDVNRRVGAEAGIQHLLELREGIDFDLEEARHRPQPACLERCPFSPRRQLVERHRGDVIVLDQHRVVKTNAMTVTAATPNGIFLQDAQSRRGLPRVEEIGRNFSLRAHRPVVRLRDGRDAAESRQQIEQRSLKGQNVACRAFERTQSLRWLECESIRNAACGKKLDPSRKGRGEKWNARQPGDNAPITRTDRGPRRLC